VIRDKRQHAAAGLGDAPLRKPHELDVIIVQPFRVAFTQGRTINLEVTFGHAGILG
jgi:hypothetical protein